MIIFQCNNILGQKKKYAAWARGLDQSSKDGDALSYLPSKQFFITVPMAAEYYMCKCFSLAEGSIFNGSNIGEILWNSD